jgi:unsaturated rhamnogalacturonyl hydrolase
MKRLCLLIGFIVPSYLTFCQSASATWSVKFSNAIISRYQPTINAMTSKGWEYSNSIILHGMEKVYMQTNDPAYLSYIKAYIDSYLNADGSFKAGVTLVSLDRIHPGISVLFLYEKYKSISAADSLKYRVCATNLRNVLVGGSASYSPYRTPTKGMFWHKQASNYTDVVMLDGMYMAHPFLAKYGRLFNDAAAIDTAVNQILFTYNQLYVSATKLIKHAWHEPGSTMPATTPATTWPDASGNSTSVWSRAMGWYTMALVDLLKYVPAAHPKRAQLLAALSNLAAGIKTYQDATSKLWFQVVDKNASSLSGNYLETSGSGMFIYTLKTAADSGWISSATYLPVAQSAWSAIQTKITTYSDGKPQINDFAPAMSVQNTEAEYVQASLQPVDCPVASGTQHPHGYAAILMAASVMEFPLVTLPVKFTDVTATLQASDVLLRWQNTDYNEVEKYIVERSENGIDFSPITQFKSQSINNQWIDVAPAGITLYYRVKSLSFDNTVVYSKIVSITKATSNARLSISPNPVNNGIVKVDLQGLKEGKYRLTVFNSTGEVITRKTIIGNRQVEEEIHLPSSSKGIVYVEVKGDKTILKKSILVH